jgi:glycogen debranching enzyme
MDNRSPAAADVEPHDPHTVHPGRESLDDRLRILKHGETFAVFDRHGDANLAGASQGLYHEGTRHLSLLALTIDGERPLLLKSTMDADDIQLVVDTTNPELSGVEQDTLHLFRSKVLRDGVLHEKLRITNHGMTRVSVPLVWRVGADFVDLFEVRGTRRAKSGKRLTPECNDDGVRLAYRGLDGVVRRTDIVCVPRPTRVTASELRCEVQLDPKGEVAIELQISCESDHSRLPRRRGVPFEAAFGALREERRLARARAARVEADDAQYQRWLDRCVADLYLMITDTQHGPYPYAGIPWYSTVFGRDGIITARAMLAIDPAVARGVLRFLAATQANSTDPAHDAEPGKIVHEMRHGEMAALAEIPFGRYYGTVDATPLFVVLAGAYLDRTGDLETIRAIAPSVNRALAWIDATCARHPRGFLAYARMSGDGLVQQGWKDSDTAVFHADGALAPGPIALCEVQGYVYDARHAAARIARALDDAPRADRLEAEAEDMRARFEDAFWVEELGTYAIAICGEGRPCRVRSSNPGHCLWSGIASPERARRVAAQLLGDDMFSGWGVRTISTREIRYNPMSYHNGSVWPHDTALVAAGLARYGMRKEALRILDAMYAASQHMDSMRMPELICGFARKSCQGPTLYPVACSPQAWSAAAPLLVLEACLGLALDGRSGTVRVDTPCLPECLDRLALRGLAIGSDRVDVVVARNGEELTWNASRISSEP